MTEQEARAAVVAEAKTWLGTPYHLNAKIKGVGVDCGTFLVSAFSGVGLIPETDLGVIMQDFNLHRNDEVYLRWILQFCKPITSDQVQAGDIILYRFGRIISHGALVTAPPRVIHASQQGVIMGNAGDPLLAPRQTGIFTLKNWEVSA